MKFYILFILCTIVLYHCQVYNKDGLVIEWDNSGELSLDIPDTWDCMKECKDERADRCILGYCFELCFDTDHDFVISEKELDSAFKKHLSWIERMATYSAKDWIKFFDGSDGSIKDSAISANELQYAEKVACSDLIKMRDNLCGRCEQFNKK